MLRVAQRVPPCAAGAGGRPYRPYLVAGLVAGALGGSLLGAWAIVAIHGGGPAPRPGLVQAHAHLQLAGLLGLVTLGLAFHLAPRLRGTKLRHAGAVTAALPLLAASALFRDLALALGAPAPVLAALPAAAAAQLAGATVAAVSLVATLRSGDAPRGALERFATLGSLGLPLAAAVDFVGLLAAARSGAPALPSGLAAAGSTLLLFGFVVPWSLAVSVRTLPVVLALPPSRPRRGLSTAAALLGAGTLVEAGALAAGSAVRGVPSWLGPLGVAVASSGLLLVVFALGPFRRGLHPGEPFGPRLVRLAYASLALGAAIRLGGAALALAGHGLGGAPDDAGRHLVGLGFCVSLVAGMGQRMIPGFEGRPLALPKLVPVTFGLLVAALVLRAAVLPASLGVPACHGLAAASGPLGWLATLTLAASLLGTLRPAPAPPPRRVLVVETKPW